MDSNEIVASLRRTLSEAATFSGRTSRRDYWTWFAVAAATYLVAAIIDRGLDTDGALAALVLLVFTLPSVAVAARRLHDCSRSGWWQLVALVPFGVFYLWYLLAQPGDAWANNHGDRPSRMPPVSPQSSPSRAPISDGNSSSTPSERTNVPEPSESVTPTPALSGEERSERLSHIISSWTMQGWVVVDRDDRNATAVLLRPAQPVNHVLHLLISTFTCGLWLVVWAVMAMTQQREQRARMSIDRYGNLVQERMTL